MPSEKTKRTFGEVPVGARFAFQNRTFQEIAVSMAEDQQRHGNIFLAETEVDVAEPGERRDEGAEKR